MPKYIDGIFNYCDRWCERCPFTTRCRSFAMGRAMERHTKRKDKENEAFWEAMDAACGDALAELDRRAGSLGATEPADADDDQQGKAAFGRELDAHDRAIRAHPLARLSEQYMWAAHRWLERRRGRVPADIAEVFDVISWYHMFIGVKFARALSGVVRIDDDDDLDEDDDLVDENGVPFPKDSDGSAKIAIIAIERSFAAWSLVRDRWTDIEKKTAAKMMGMLLRLRASAEAYFPDARRFHRPGFDDVGSKD